MANPEQLAILKLGRIAALPSPGAWASPVVVADSGVVTQSWEKCCGYRSKESFGILWRRETGLFPRPVRDLAVQTRFTIVFTCSQVDVIGRPKIDNGNSRLIRGSYGECRLT